MLVISFLLLLLVLGWAMGQYDYARLVDGKRPLFARLQFNLADGGSVQYCGPGYTVTDRHELRWGIEMPPEPGAKVTPFRVGPTLDYWTPFISREHTRFLVETNK